MYWQPIAIGSILTLAISSALASQVEYRVDCRERPAELRGDRLSANSALFAVWYYHHLQPVLLAAHVAADAVPLIDTLDSPAATTSTSSRAPPWRMLVDVGNPDDARMTNAPGRSGAPRSSTCGYLLEGWAHDERFAFVHSRARVEMETVDVIRLQPERPDGP